MMSFAVVVLHYLGGGFKYFVFLPLPQEMIKFDYYFSNGLKPPTSYVLMTVFECFG